MASKAFANPHGEIGTELVREWSPGGEAKAWIVLVHGLGEHSGRYERTGDLFAERGYGVRGFDLIGAGGSGGPRWHIDDWSRYHDQVQSHVEHVREKGTPVVLLGHSLGGAISLGYLLDDRPAPNLAVLSAPALAGGSPALKAVVPLLAKVIPKVSVPNPVKGEQLSRDPEVGERYFADPLVITKSTPLFAAEAFTEIDRLNETLDQLDIPTLVIHGSEDTLVPTRSSEPLADVDAVERRVYEGLLHECFNEPEGPQVVSDIADWLDARI